MLEKVICFISTLLIVSGFMFDDPCDIYPRNEKAPWDPNATFSMNAPTGCKNGTIWWNYPCGHVLLYFSNPQQTEEAVCIQDYAGGQTFKITDKTDNKTLVLGDDREQWTCTEPRTDRTLVLQFDAPEMMTYMGAVYYRINDNNS